MVNALTLFAEETVQKSPDSPLALAICVVAAVLVSGFLEYRRRKKEQKEQASEKSTPDNTNHTEQ